MASSAVCAKSGCNLPVYVEPRTKIAHRYCGRTHALEAMGNTNVQKPHGICHRCNLSGCTNTAAFDSRTGRVHDFCCKDHADRAIRSGAWVKPVRDAYLYYDGAKKKAAGPTCKLPSCSLPVFTDPSSGRKLDYCGRSHAVEHRLLQDRVRHTSSSSSSSSLAAVAGGGTLFTTGLAVATPVTAVTGLASTAMTPPSNQDSARADHLRLSPTKTYVLRFDGGSRGNPGVSGAGMVLYEKNHFTNEIWCGSLFLTRNGTNNEAEYKALINGLKCAKIFGVKHLVVEGDSDLVVRQMLGSFECKSPNLIPLRQEAILVTKNFLSFQIRHIPRAQNYRADELANEAMSSMRSRGVEVLFGEKKKG
jgi:ribonuclease HI